MGIIQPDRVGTRLTLDCAVHCNRLGLARVLLDHGTDIEAKDNNGFSALQHAAQRGYPPNIKFLIEKGADLQNITSQYPDVQILCERAAAHANGSKLSREAWRKFWDSDCSWLILP
ncbi:hypothetical protein FB567DRAFT_511260 [Paraphoma chrysanthemicola]|uniref:Ankyrin repeat protein n=1 Tax=Paraphoma chrysanthemicola TaxID=798071 RepID=A0A8K0RGG5_9PLEO|nr:hypothetical protein FB567DRAFT_511260 [Paraphoma chrysanthemicola]